MHIRNKTETVPSSEKAYSLVEVLVAVVVLGIMFVSLYSGFSAGFAVTQLARENLRATQILQEKMETIRLYTWDQINTPGFMPTNFVESFYAVGTNANSMTYTGTVWVTKAPSTNSYSNELKLVNIKLNWVSADVQRTRQMQTYVTRHGLQNYIY
ncbi:MAG TPA: prepilin-type N-terminal cleavage/methylation domain-containing protein [Verrucomicrobiae bacterium]